MPRLRQWNWLYLTSEAMTNNLLVTSEHHKELETLLFTLRNNIQLSPILMSSIPSSLRRLEIQGVKSTPAGGEHIKALLCLPNLLHSKDCL
jgi:sulfite reductase beta subunit-like hemoprotein